MKKRIIALVLVVVMSLLAMTSCDNSFDFAEEDLSKYATKFNYTEFKNALNSIEIVDGDFTNDETTRQELVTKDLYDSVVSGIISSSYESDWVKEGTLSAGDVLYFVYFAEYDGHIFNYNQMDVSTLTGSNKAAHVINLGNVDEDNEFMVQLKDHLVEGADLSEYVYSMLTADEISALAREALLTEKPGATSEELAKAAADAIKLKEGDTIVISYNVSYQDPDSTETTIIKKAATHEEITLTADHPLYGLLCNAETPVSVGDTVAKSSGDNAYVDANNHSYTDVKVLWRVESKGKPISTFTYKHYTASTQLTPSSLYSSTADKIQLQDKEVTFHVYPVYALNAPTPEEITATDILLNVYGSKLNENSFNIFEDTAFVNDQKNVTDIVKDIVNVYDTKAENNPYYKDGSDLKKLLTAYNDAVTAGGSKPNDTQQAKIDDASEKLNKAQRAELEKLVEKLVNATKSGALLGDAIVKEQRESTYYKLEVAYTNDIVNKVQEKVWALIEAIEIDDNAYPAELVEEFKNHIYEEYEYEYYTGKTDFDKYPTFEGYLAAKTTDKKVTEAAKGYIKPMIQIFVVARACEADALKNMSKYVEADITAGLYEIDEQYYKDSYGDKATQYIAEAKENIKESIAEVREEAKSFIVDDAYMEAYKNRVGSAYYDDLVEEYGEYNLRTSFQFNKLFYYLTGANAEKADATYLADSARDGYVYTEVVYKDGFIDFRNVKYSFEVEDETAE